MSQSIEESIALHLKSKFTPDFKSLTLIATESEKKAYIFKVTYDNKTLFLYANIYLSFIGNEPIENWSISEHNTSFFIKELNRKCFYIDSSRTKKLTEDYINNYF